MVAVITTDTIQHIAEDTIRHSDSDSVDTIQHSDMILANHELGVSVAII